MRYPLYQAPAPEENGFLVISTNRLCLHHSLLSIALKLTFSDMPSTHNPYLTRPDRVALDSLVRDGNHEHSDLNQSSKQLCEAYEDQKAARLLKGFNDVASKRSAPTVVTSWDTFPEYLDKLLIRPYNRWASAVVRRPTDIVFVTHILLYSSTSVSSSLVLYYRFTWIHAILHWLMQAWYYGPFTLMLHNHIHDKGVLALEYAWFDKIWPYVLQPLMGHTWDTYYYHHIKHHRVENNGSGDLSSTIRYQRDNLFILSAASAGLWPSSGLSFHCIYSEKGSQILRSTP